MSQGGSISGRGNDKRVGILKIFSTEKISCFFNPRYRAVVKKLTWGSESEIGCQTHRAPKRLIFKKGSCEKNVNKKKRHLLGQLGVGRRIVAELPRDRDRVRKVGWSEEVEGVAVGGCTKRGKESSRHWSENVACIRQKISNQQT